MENICDNAKRILHANIFNFGFNGLSTIVYQWGMNINSEKYIYDYCGSRPIVHKYYENEIKRVSGRIYTMPSSDKLNFFTRHIRYWKFLTHVVKENKYEIVHLHSDLSSNLLERAIICKIAGVKKIIIHSHSTGADHASRHIRSIYHYLCKPFLPIVATDYLACSRDAAKWMYPEKVLDKVVIINNGIPVEKFRFNPLIRNDIRNKFEWEDSFVVGHIGRFTFQKNHEFIINVFSDLLNYIPNAKLLLIGEGELLENVFSMAKSKKILDKIKHIPFTESVQDYLNVMDCFILPSRFEGLGVVSIEAQASGLPTIVSDRIPREAFITDLIKALPINDSVDKWVEELILINQMKIDRNKYIDLVRRSGYSLETSAKQLEQVYDR